MRDPLGSRTPLPRRWARGLLLLFGGSIPRDENQSDREAPPVPCENDFLSTPPPRPVLLLITGDGGGMGLSSGRSARAGTGEKSGSGQGRKVPTRSPTDWALGGELAAVLEPRNPRPGRPVGVHPAGERSGSGAPVSKAGYRALLFLLPGWERREPVTNFSQNGCFVHVKVL